MKLARYFFVLLLLSCSFLVHAQLDSLELHLDTVGTLSLRIDSAQKSSLTSLKLSGTINGTDILFLREMGGSDKDGKSTTGKLSHLDLTNVTIDASGLAYYKYFTAIRRTLSTNFFYGCTRLKSIRLPKNVEAIVPSAFTGCIGLVDILIDSLNPYFSSLEGVLYSKDFSTLLYYPNSKDSTFSLPNSVTSMVNYAFAGCSNLRSITLSNSLKEIGERSFYKCINLSSIRIPNSVEKIGKYAFESCENLSKINLPDKLSSLELGLFFKCSKLDSVTLPFSVKAIADACFSYCENLKSIYIPSYVESIGKSAFSYCRTLSEIGLPSMLTSIGDDAFYHCDSLTRVTIPARVSSMGPRVFGECTHLSQVDLPASLTVVPYKLFENCTMLSSISMPETLVEIQGRVFENCKSLTDLVLPSSIQILGSSVFRNCIGLTEVHLPPKIKALSATFDGCINLSFVTLPDSLVSVGENTFRDCIQLTSFDLPKGVLSLVGGSDYYVSSGIMNNTSIECLNLPPSVKNITSGSLNNCSTLQRIEVDEANEYYSSIDGVLYSKFGEELVSCPNFKCSTYTIPDFVQSVGAGAFAYCSNLTSIFLPDNVLKIKPGAFSRCANLKEIRLPENLESIGNRAFWRCNQLASVIIPDNTVEIEQGAFESCTSISTISLGMYTDSIGEDAFVCPKLRSIHCRSMEPPKIVSSPYYHTFHYVNKDSCVVYVPTGTKLKYASAPGWWDFKNFVEEEIVSIPKTLEQKHTVRGLNGKVSITGLKMGETVEVYTLQGVLLRKIKATNASLLIVLPTSSLYLVRLGADTHKVLL